MTPFEDDPGIWEATMRILRQIGDSMAYVMPFLAPAFLGALLSAWRSDRRRKSRWHWVSLVAWSMAAGAGFAPLFMHLFNLPETVAGSAACALAFFGKDGTDMIRRVLSHHSGPGDVAPHASEGGEEPWQEGEPEEAEGPQEK